MNEEQWRNWIHTAVLILICTKKYSDKEICKIINWFKMIDGASERALIGDRAVDAHLAMVQAVADKVGFDLYGSLMSRLFIYAPLILKEELAFDEESDDIYNL